LHPAGRFLDTHARHFPVPVEALAGTPTVGADGQPMLAVQMIAANDAAQRSKICDLSDSAIPIPVSPKERGRINITVNTARQIAPVLQISLSELFRGLS